MIPNNFDYYLPCNFEESTNIYKSLKSENRNPMFYAGGSEIITMARASTNIPTDIIDLKGINECQELKIENDKLIIGSCVTLSKIKESLLFPLLGLNCGRIADHTNQNRITIGGNVCGSIIYKEAVLPLLLTDSIVCIYSNNEEKEIQINSIFNQKINLQDGEFIIRFKIDTKYLNNRFYHIKKTENEKIDYPLVTVSALEVDNKLRIAFSGICPFPFRSLNIENILNDSSLTNDEKISSAISNIPTPLIDYKQDYRKFVLNNTLKDILEKKGWQNDNL